jgi:hypothetical protein
MWGGGLSRSLAVMHTLNAAAIADQFVTERVATAARARRFARVRRKFARGERRVAPSSPLPGALPATRAGR